MRDSMQQDAQAQEAVPESEPAHASEPADVAFTSTGALPPVEATTDQRHAPTASERGYEPATRGVTPPSTPAAAPVNAAPPQQAPRNQPVRHLDATNIARRDNHVGSATPSVPFLNGFELADGHGAAAPETSAPAAPLPLPPAFVPPPTSARPAPTLSGNGARRLSATNVVRRDNFTGDVTPAATPATEGFEQGE